MRHPHPSWEGRARVGWIFAVNTGGGRDQNQPTSQERGGADGGAEIRGDMVVVVEVEC